MTGDSAWRRAGDCAADACELEDAMVARVRAGGTLGRTRVRQFQRLHEEARLIIDAWYRDWERYGAPP